MNKLYKNFFQWLKETNVACYKKHPNCIYSPGIEDDVFVYFLEMYLYKGDPNINHINKLKYILRKYSKRYRRERFFSKLGIKYKYHRKDEYLDKHCFHNNLTFDEFYKKTYDEQIFPKISDLDYVNFILDYDLIPATIFVDPISTTQMNLYYCEEILHKCSFKFKLEEKLYKTFNL